MSATTTLVGNATADVELRYTQSGKAVGNVTIAVSDRVKGDDGQWKDGKTWFARCTLWGELAENAAASISKGTRVIGHGRIEQRDWEDRDGNKSTSVEVTLDAIGPDLRYATAVVSRNASHSPQEPRGGASGAGQALGDTFGFSGAQAADSWNVSSMADTPF